MRGKAFIAVGSHSSARITPAYAGKRPRRGYPLHKFWDHPRVCGEKSHSCSPAVAAQGSPPRMRGKGSSGKRRFHLRRITPAYAGKSDMHANGFCCPKDHPRVCGEKHGRDRRRGRGRGSPPRMRGKAPQQMLLRSTSGITPAYAGKRQKKGDLKNDTQDHPRVCGEKLAFFVFCPYVLGSPPRMRGKGKSSGSTTRIPRITPAYAGKSCTLCWSLVRLRDHPRVCGEKQYQPCTGSKQLGSPPRMRGKD